MSECLHRDTVMSESVYNKTCYAVPFRGGKYVHPAPPKTIDGERCYVVFTLFGKSKKYWVGMLKNILTIKHFLQGWRTRIYVPPDIAVDLVDVLVQDSANHGAAGIS